MKRYTLLLIALFVLPALSYANDKEDPVDSSVKEVTVFRNGAQLTRQVTVMLSPGRNEILFKGLTSYLKPETIQLSGDGNFMILSLTNRRDYLEEHPQKERLQQLVDQRDALELQIENKKTEKNILEQELNILLSNTNLKGNQQNLTAIELKEAMDYFHQKLSELKTQTLTLSREIAKLEKELQGVKNQISELDSNASTNRSVVSAVLQSDSEQEVQLKLTYLVSRAGWNPSYDIRVEDIETPVNLSYKANVYQHTGVDWNDVSLHISSAVPEKSGVLPKLQPWYLRFVKPRPQARTADQMIAIPQPEFRKQGAQEVAISEIQHQTSFSYKIELPYDVPSGGNPLTVEVKNSDIAADYQYFTVPKQRNKAYLTADIGNWGGYNLLPGEANLFFEQMYVGKSSIAPQSVGDSLSFSLGTDESIVTERKKLREFEEKNFFGNKVTESFAWEISVRNSKDQAVQIKVNDQVPVSQNEDIKVSLEQKSGANYAPQTGMLTWQLQLDPGETKTVRFDYEIEYPKGKQVTF